MALVLASFIIFILSFFVRFHYNQGESMDLVVEDYYNHGLKYQEELNAISNVKNLPNPPKILLEDNLLKIQFPEEDVVVSGEVGIYRPSNKKLDHNFPLTLTDREMNINEKAFTKGPYEIHLFWRDNLGKSYLIKQRIVWK